MKIEIHGHINNPFEIYHFSFIIEHTVYLNILPIIKQKKSSAQNLIINN